MKRAYYSIKAVSSILALLLLLTAFSAAVSATGDDITGAWSSDGDVRSILTLDASKASLTAYNANSKDKNVICVIAFYDGDGRIISVKAEAEKAGQRNGLSAEMPENASLAKGFVMGEDGLTLTVCRARRPSTSVYVMGDSALTAHDTFDVFYSMARAGGHDVDFHAGTYRNFAKGPDSTYSLYELVSFSGSGNNIKAAGFKKEYFRNAITSPLDCLVLMTSRDRIMMSSVGDYNKTRMLEAFDLIQRTYYAANPDGRILLLAPPAYKDTQGEFGTYFSLNGVTPREHSEMISAFARQMAEKASGSVTIAPLCDAFDWLHDNYGAQGYDLYDSRNVYPNIAGSYYIACLVYAYIFGESPAGLSEKGLLNDSAAEFIQKAAHKYVFGEDAPEKAAHDDPIPHKSFEDCDPRTMPVRDERYGNEVYPEYFDEFFATAYNYEAFGGAVQYDQKKIATNTASTRRLHQGVNPRFITPQRISFLDCTWFCHSVYYSAFDYVIKESLNTYVIDITEGEVYRRTPEEIANDRDEAIESFLDTVQPGDMIMYYNRSAQSGHGLLYIGNGMLMHCSGYSHKTSSSSDYDFDTKTDGKELLGGVAYAPLRMLTEETGSFYAFKDGREVLILRPLSLGIKPNANAVKRAQNLKGVLCWKETSKPGGTSVNPGEDVTFTYKIRNDSMEEKQISVKDKLPANTAFKSGDLTFTNGILDTTVTVPARSEISLSFTVTVSPSAPYGKIPCGDTEIGGVKLYDYAPIYVSRSLTAEEKAAIAGAAVTGQTDSELVANAYAEIGKDFTLPAGKALSDKYFTVSGDNVSVTFKDKTLIPQNLYGGRGYGGREVERIRHISVQNVMCGDVLVVLREPDKKEEAQCWLCVGDGNFITVENGAVVKVSNASAASLFDSLFGQFAFIVIRPSFGF